MPRLPLMQVVRHWGGGLGVGNSVNGVLVRLVRCTGGSRGAKKKKKNFDKKKEKEKHKRKES